MEIALEAFPRGVACLDNPRPRSPQLLELRLRLRFESLVFECQTRRRGHLVDELLVPEDLRRVARFTETASPPYVLTDHGLIARYVLPGGGTVTVFSGFQQIWIDPPLGEIFRGNPFDELDRQAFCAALS